MKQTKPCLSSIPSVQAPRARSRAWLWSAALLAACTIAADDAGDPEHASFTGPKADGFCADEESPEATGILALVNDEATTFEELDRPTRHGGAGLDRRAAENIVAARPFESLAQLDAVPFVGPVACSLLLDYACEVQGRCDAAPGCDPGQFEARPARTSYDARCEQIVVALLTARPTGTDRSTVTDASARCEDLDATQRRAFDAVAIQFGVSPTEFSDAFGEFSIVQVDIAADRDVHLVHVIEENNFMPFHVVFDGSDIAAIWSTDGLSSGVDWFCGGSGESAEAPDELCVGALTDDVALCDRDAAADSQITRSVADAAEQPSDLINAAILEHARTHDLPDQETLVAEVETCSAATVIVTLADPDGEPQAYHVVDSTRAFGTTVLSRTDSDGQTTLVCARPEF